MIHHTENETTVKRGQSIATIIADSIWNGKRITTLELVYPRYIHSELMTHRVFSRNASSSRATPLNVMVKEVIDDPVFFDYVGRNQSGMVAGEKLTGEELACFKDDWELLGAQVAHRIERMSEKYGIHKQTLNRALEPWSRIRTLVTATDWDNFYKLRLAEDAQPEIRMLARAMGMAMIGGYPAESEFHLPYVNEYHPLQGEPTIEMIKCSVARCARVSYARLDGKPVDIAADLKLYDKLLESGHLSPFEHVACAGEGRFANFDGWESWRHYIENK